MQATIDELLLQWRHFGLFGTQPFGRGQVLPAGHRGPRRKILFRALCHFPCHLGHQPLGRKEFEQPALGQQPAGLFQMTIAQRLFGFPHFESPGLEHCRTLRGIRKRPHRRFVLLADRIR